MMMKNCTVCNIHPGFIDITGVGLICGECFTKYQEKIKQHNMMIMEQVKTEVFK